MAPRSGRSLVLLSLLVLGIAPLSGCLSSQGGNHAPTAAITSPSTVSAVLVGEPILFDGSTSADRDDDRLGYLWDFGDDSGAAGPVVNHTFLTGGTYTVTLTVTDGAEDANDSVALVVDTPPIARISLHDPVVALGSTVRLSANGSSDPDGDVLRYAWSVGGVAVGTNVTLEVTPSAVGNLTVALEAGDGTTTASTAVQLFVYQPNRPPTAVIRIASTDPEDGQSVLFDGNGSTDPDGDGLTYAWDFGDNSSGSGAFGAHVYTAAGTYEVVLRVSDGPLQDRANATLVIAQHNRAPAVLFEVLLPTGESGVSVAHGDTDLSFNASASTDPDGDALTYEWDFGDGNGATNRQTTHHYDFVGDYLVRLTVADGHHSVDATRALRIVPVASITLDWQDDQRQFLAHLDERGDLPRYSATLNQTHKGASESPGVPLLIIEEGDGLRLYETSLQIDAGDTLDVRLWYDEVLLAERHIEVIEGTPYPDVDVQTDIIFDLDQESVGELGAGATDLAEGHLAGAGRYSQHADGTLVQELTTDTFDLFENLTDPVLGQNFIYTASGTKVTSNETRLGGQTVESSRYTVMQSRAILKAGSVTMQDVNTTQVLERTNGDLTYTHAESLGIVRFDPSSAPLAYWASTNTTGAESQLNGDGVSWPCLVTDTTMVISGRFDLGGTPTSVRISNVTTTWSVQNENFTNTEIRVDYVEVDEVFNETSLAWEVVGTRSGVLLPDSDEDGTANPDLALPEFEDLVEDTGIGPRLWHVGDVVRSTNPFGVVVVNEGLEQKEWEVDGVTYPVIAVAQTLQSAPPSLGVVSGGQELIVIATGESLQGTVLQLSGYQDLVEVDGSFSSQGMTYTVLSLTLE